jgi:glycerophosphoryl diester phosphodiesterase
MQACRPHEPRVTLARYVAHAMGEIDGYTYTNSLEAWRANYAKGCRLFEVDLWMTPDGKLVAFHNGFEGALNLVRDFTHGDFMQIRIFGKYSPLDSERIAQLLEERRDWKIVTDTKNELRRSLESLCASLRRRDIDCADRVIPQIYRPEVDLPITKQLGFRQVIFTIYRGRLDDRNIVRLGRADPRVIAVTMPPARANPSMVRALSDAGIRTYVHTVNGEAIARQFRSGVWGVYTDTGCR